MNPLAHTEPLPRTAPARVLGVGAYLKNRACLLEGNQAHWSALHGDLGSPDSRAALHESVDTLLAGSAGPLHAIAHDLHPDFYSTQLAQELAQRLNVPLVGVQHHRAHVEVVLAEHGFREPVIGMALDGMGWGADGSAWGGEVLWMGDATQGSTWQRLDHLAPLALPGGDLAAREPWRLAASVLFAVGRGAEIEPRYSLLAGGAAKTVHTMLQRRVNCPDSTSAGRWFDAAAGALGICLQQTHEAQAAMALEQLAAQWLSEHPDFEYPWTSLDMYPIVADLCAWAGQGSGALARGAAQFHLALASGLAHSAIQAAHARGIGQVVLSGGCLANRVLNQAIQQHLRRANLQVVEPRHAGCGDEGLALGQAWSAAFGPILGQAATSVRAPVFAASAFALEN